MGYATPVLLKTGLFGRGPTLLLLFIAIPVFLFVGLKLGQDPTNTSKRNVLILVFVIFVLIAAFSEFVASPL
jgi:hypothetical protein